MRSRFAVKMLAALTLAGVALAACGDDDDEQGTLDTTAAPAAETTAAPAETTAAPAETTAPADTTALDDDAATTAAAATQPAGEATLTIAETDLGAIVADGEGKTLYLYTNDTAGTSTCEGGCAEAWPPLLVDGGAIAGEGIDEADIATITRSDGSTQLTYYGHPLYYFASDLGAGDTTGQGVGGVWYVLDAEGNQIG